MTEILHFSTEQVFDQTDIVAMRRALDDALHALAFAYREDDPPDATTRDELARAIVKVAGRGERNVERLCAQALHALAPRPAYYAHTENQRAIA